MESKQWIRGFVSELVNLGKGQNEDALRMMAIALHRSHGHLDPVEVAQAEFDVWPLEAM